MKQFTDKTLERLTKQANSDKAKKECSPDVLWHETMNTGQGRRFLWALDKEGYKVVKK